MCGTNKDARYIFDEIKSEIENELEEIKRNYLNTKNNNK